MKRHWVYWNTRWLVILLHDLVSMNVTKFHEQGVVFVVAKIICIVQHAISFSSAHGKWLLYMWHFHFRSHENWCFICGVISIIHLFNIEWFRQYALHEMLYSGPLSPTGRWWGCYSLLYPFHELQQLMIINYGSY